MKNVPYTVYRVYRLPSTVYCAVDSAINLTNRLIVQYSTILFLDYNNIRFFNIEWYVIAQQHWNDLHHFMIYLSHHLHAFLCFIYVEKKKYKKKSTKFSFFLVPFVSFTTLPFFLPLLFILENSDLNRIFN